MKLTVNISFFLRTSHKLHSQKGYNKNINSLTNLVHPAAKYTEISEIMRPQTMIQLVD